MEVPGDIAGSIGGIIKMVISPINLKTNFSL